MKRRFKLPLAGHWFTVDVVPLEKEDLYGECDHKTQTIRIAEEATEDFQEETLIHECIHAVSHMYGLGLGEKTTQRLGAGLHQMLAKYLRLPK